MSLDEYRRKRSPRKTPEPFGSGKKRQGDPRFVVQRHAARRLHYDFRLERHGALASWAVPKGVPLEPGERRLAVHVEDHPLEYGNFEGVIPAGEYGAGTVEIWDHGTYELLEEKRDGGLTVRLEGERLNGVWTLVPAHMDGDPKNWLLLRKDGAARAGGGRFPMLSTSSESLPEGDGWIYEPKWDGFRAIVTVAAGEATLTSRNGNDLTDRFRKAARAAELGVRSADAVLDAEICALDERGRSSFSLLQQSEGALTLVVFDLLEVDGESVVGMPLVDRRARLEQLVDTSRGGIALSPQFEDGGLLLQAAAEQGLEGVVAKRLDSRYQPGRRSPDWRKVKVKGRQEVVVAGYTKGQGRRSQGFGALVVGVHEAGGLRWAGNVGTGFSDAEIKRLRDLMRPLERAESPFADVPKMPRVRRSDVVWLEPRLVAEVEFVEWTREGRLRAPVYVGIREDKPADDVRRERSPVPEVVKKGKRELRLSNLDKIFWPEEGISKGDLIAYYRDVAAVLVPHLRHRPFTMRRHPDGWQGKHFFQKQAPSHMPSWIKRETLPATTREGDSKTIDYALVDDELALLWMVNMGCIDMHVWASRVDLPDRPDWVMFDLDPSEGATFEDVIDVAKLVKEALDLLGLAAFPKTSGSRGIHVLVPIARRSTFAEAREFAAIVAGALARAHPGLVTTEWVKKKRRGVLVDANQNGPGKTNASVYSVRPRAGAMVSTPLRWEEVVSGLDPTAFTMDAVLDRVARDGDLFAGVLEGGQSLAKALRALR
ncbi:MAG: DNA ligase D [Actinobacteria bacterium]|nr:DNA ligase D [Actinomycetota bacterium]